MIGLQRLALASVAMLGTGACSDPGADRANSGAGFPFDDRQAKAFVLVFVRTDCPIANAYAPRITQIAESYAGSGVRFWLVYPEAGESDDAIRQHIADYSLPPNYIRDGDHELVGMAGPQVTPEAAVFVNGAAGPELVYCGRIDDQYVAFGKRRIEPSIHDLRMVLDAILNFEPVEMRRTEAVGCTIPELER